MRQVDYQQKHFYSKKHANFAFSKDGEIWKERSITYTDEPSQLTAFEHTSETLRLLSYLEWLLLEEEEAAKERIKTRSMLGQSSNGGCQCIDVP